MNPVSAPEPSSRDAARRRFLKGGVALGAALAAGAARSAAGQPVSEDPSKVLGGPVRPYGERSRFEETVREKWPPSTDGGKTWRDARLQAPVLRFAHTRFRLDWRWDGRETVLQSRCIDETGYVQPTLTELAKVRGLNSIYFNNAIQSWKVAVDGSVHNVHA